jgi:hypothetical protein
MASLTAIFHAPIHLAMMRLDSLNKTQRLPPRHCSDDKPPWKRDMLAAALAVSLSSRPTEVGSQQKTPPYGDGKPRFPCMNCFRLCKAIMASVQEDHIAKDNVR